MMEPTGRVTVRHGRHDSHKQLAIFTLSIDLFAFRRDPSKVALAKTSLKKSTSGSKEATAG